MKICILAGSLNTYTGVGEFVDNLIESTKELMPETTFFVMTKEELLKPGYVSIVKNWRHIRHRIKESDIIHAIDAYPYGLIAALANIFINKPFIITAVGTGSLQLFSHFPWSVFIRWTYLRSNYVTAISKYVADKIEKNVKKIKVEVINPGIDFDYWSTVHAKSLDSRLKGLRPYILSVGELKRRKGYHVMLPIISEVLKINPSANYVIVANIERNSEYRDELYRQIKKLGIDDKVIILSDLSRDDLRNVFQHAYLYFTLPQNIEGDIEGFGMSILQAASAGAPTLVGEGSGADDAVAHNLSGLLVKSEKRNRNEVIKKINELLRDKTLRDQFGKGAKEFAMKMQWQNQIKPYIKIYKKLAK